MKDRGRTHSAGNMERGKVACVEGGEGEERRGEEGG